MKAKRPINSAYPKELITLGDHLRRVRLDRGLSKPKEATIFKCSIDMVTNWELNRNQPTVKFTKKVFEFLGYFPFKIDNLGIWKKLYFLRLISGKTQKEVSKEIKLDQSSLRYIGLGIRFLNSSNLKKINVYVDLQFRNSNFISVYLARY